MIRPGDRVLAAVSGGSDSMALLHLLARESKHLGFDLAVAHFDHALRSGSRQDARFVEAAAGRMGLPFFAGEGDVRALARAERRCMEDAARAARHRFLRATLQSWGGNRIALAHQADDLCEGILMRLVEGTGLAGLAGMKPVSGPLIRPLLFARREQIRAWLEREDIAWREDESNASVAPLRNRVRHRLLPLLGAEFNPSIVAALQRMSGLLADEDAFLDDLVSDWFERHARCGVSEAPAGHGTPAGPGAPAGPGSPRAVSLARAELARMPRPLQRRILRRSLHEAGLSPRLVRFDQIETIVRLLAERRSGSCVTLAGGYSARIERGEVRLGLLGPAPARKGAGEARGARQAPARTPA